jgi:hypothetical protein
VYYNLIVSEKLLGWRYIGAYAGQHPGYAELDDPPMPVKVEIYGRGNKRKAIGNTGEIVFSYTVYPENFNWHLREKK